MVRAYYFDGEPTDQRLPHDSHRNVDDKQLRSLGVKHWHIPAIKGSYEPQIDEVAKNEGYKNRDEINVSRQGLGDAYETKLKSFFEE